MSDIDKKEEVVDTTPSVQEVLDSTPKEIKDFWLAIFLELNRSERYQKLVEEHFDIRKVINEEDKIIQINVIEKPPVDKDEPFVVNTTKMMKMHVALAQHGCKRPAAALATIMKVLRGKHVTAEQAPPLIVPANEADMDDEVAAARKQADLKKKLD